MALPGPPGRCTPPIQTHSAVGRSKAPVRHTVIFATRLAGVAIRMLLRSEVLVVAEPIPDGGGRLRLPRPGEQVPLQVRKCRGERLFSHRQTGAAPESRRTDCAGLQATIPALGCGA